MRINSADVADLFIHAASGCDKQGLLTLSHSTRGIFRRSDQIFQRWFRLYGNLLIYLKSEDEWEEPAALFVLDHVSIIEQPPFGFTLVCEGSGLTLHLSALSEEDRQEWVNALSKAKFSTLRGRISSLKEAIAAKSSNLKLESIKPSGYISDLEEVSLCAITVSCDNVPCRSGGSSPSPRLLVHVRNNEGAEWSKYASTETIVGKSNASFATAIVFRASDGLNSDSRVKLTLLDVREQLSGTETVVGVIELGLNGLREAGRVSMSPNGYLTLTLLTVEETKSAESTPSHTTHQRRNSLQHQFYPEIDPPLITRFNNPWVRDFRFKSGLGGDIVVRETLAEAPPASLIPNKLLSLWIKEEEEKSSYLNALGIKNSPSLEALVKASKSAMKIYKEALNSPVSAFQESWRKGLAPFVPLNLHIQRMSVWVRGSSRRPRDFPTIYDTITVGAFAAHSLGFTSAREQRGFLETDTEAIRKMAACVNRGEEGLEVLKEGKRRLEKLTEKLVESPNNAPKIFPQLEELARSLLRPRDKMLFEEALEYLESVRAESGEESEPIELAALNIQAAAFSIGKSTDSPPDLARSMKKLHGAAESLIKSASLALTALRAQQDPSRITRAASIALRSRICFSQALAAAGSGLLVRLWTRPLDENFISAFITLGPLVTFHGLLTAAGDENGMLSDMAAGIDDLRTVQIRIGPFDITRSPSGLILTLPAPPALASRLPPSSAVPLNAIFFNVGVAVEAGLCDDSIQNRINITGGARLSAYAARFSTATGIVGKGENELKRLHAAIALPTTKNIEVIKWAAETARALEGIRVTGCKSGKDRTGMSVTLEQGESLVTHHSLPVDEMQSVVDAMRSQGSRREVTLKNIGVKKYAFNAGQMWALPSSLRPPAGTFGPART